MAELAEFAEDFAFGEVADAAGVEEEGVSVVFVVYEDEAAGSEEAGDDLGIEDIHLAAVGAQMDADACKLRGLRCTCGMVRVLMHTRSW